MITGFSANGRYFYMDGDGNFVSIGLGGGRELLDKNGNYLSKKELENKEWFIFTKPGKLDESDPLVTTRKCSVKDVFFPILNETANIVGYIRLNNSSELNRKFMVSYGQAKVYNNIVI